jgi:tetratricopeptide (TPR) repeat protein
MSNQATQLTLFERFLKFSAILGFVADVVSLTTVISAVLLSSNSSFPSEKGNIIINIWQSNVYRGVSLAVILYSFVVTVYFLFRRKGSKHFTDINEIIKLLRTPFHAELLVIFKADSLESINLYDCIYTMMPLLWPMLMVWMSLFYIANTAFLISSLIILYAGMIMTLCVIARWTTYRILVLVSLLTFPLISAFTFSQDINLLLGIVISVIIPPITIAALISIGLFSTHLLYLLFSPILPSGINSRTSLNKLHSQLEAQMEEKRQQERVAQRQEMLLQLSSADRFALFASEAKESNPDSAIDYLTQALQLEQRSEWYLERAKLYSARKRYTDSITDYKKALEFTKDNQKRGDIHAEMANELFSMNNINESLDHINESISISPTSWRYYHRSRIYLEIHDYELAAQDGKRAIDFSLSEDNIYRRWVTAHTRQDFSAKYWLITGIAYSKLGNQEKAMYYLRKAERLGADQASIEIARCLQHSNRHDEAIKEISPFIYTNSDKYRFGNIFRDDLKERLPEAYIIRAHSYAAKNNFKEAINDIMECVRLSPEHHQAYFLRASICWKIRLFDDARGDFRQACELSPANFQYWSAWIKKELSIQNHSKASQIIKQAIQIKPSMESRFRQSNEFSSLLDNDQV